MEFIKMSASLRNVAVQQFRDQFELEYQARQKLMNTTQVIRGAVGDAYKWPIMGPAVMLDRGADQSIIPSSDVTHTQITTTFKDKVLNTPTDIFAQATVNASERQVLASNHAAAVGRAEDQFKIDEMEIARIATTITTVPDGATNLPLEKLLEAAYELNQNSVDTNMRFIAIGASQVRSLLNDTNVTSADYNVVKVLMNGEIATFVGFQIFMIPDQYITIAGTPTKVYGLPKVGDIRYCFSWQQRAMGAVYKGYEGQANPSVTVDWDPLRQSWLTISKLSMGSSVLLPEGVVAVACDETKV